MCKTQTKERHLQIDTESKTMYIRKGENIHTHTHTYTHTSTHCIGKDITGILILIITLIVTTLLIMT